jgi:hypothetical protein
VNDVCRLVQRTDLPDNNSWYHYELSCRIAKATMGTTTVEHLNRVLYNVNYVGGWAMSRRIKDDRYISLAP